MITHSTMKQERRKIFHEKRTIHRHTDYADPEAGGERCSGHGAVPRARDRNDDLLQLAPQAWGHGRLANITDEVSFDICVICSLMIDIDAIFSRLDNSTAVKNDIHTR